MRFRIGVHLGDVIEKADGTIYGDGVNIAARLQGLADPGGITVSESIHVAVRGKVVACFVDQAEQQVKNIPHPVRAFAVLTEDSALGEIDLTLPDRPSIAVLPFTNVSGDPEQEYFADGIVEDIITALSRMRWLFVIARNSSFTYKWKSPDVRKVARELGVRYVLEGSMRKAGDRVRIVAQLIDGANGDHIWAERYDRQVVDLFAVQDDITRNVVGAIEPQLHAAENLRIQSSRRRASMRGDASYEACGTSVASARMTTNRRYNSCGRPLHRALVMRRRRACFRLPRRGRCFSVATWIRRCPPHASTHRPPGHWTMTTPGAISSGYAECFASRYDDAIAWYRRAIELNENFALAHGNMAAALALGGQPDAAIEAADRSIRMSPRDPFNFSYLHYAAIAYFAAERYAEGVACEEQTLRERPNVSTALRFLAACHVGLGQMDNARAAIAEVLRLDPDSSIKRDVYGQVAYARASDRESYATALHKAGLPEA